MYGLQIRSPTLSAAFSCCQWFPLMQRVLTQPHELMFAFAACAFLVPWWGLGGQQEAKGPRHKTAGTTLGVG